MNYRRAAFAKGCALVILLTNEDVEPLLNMPDCIAAIEAAFRDLGNSDAVDIPRQDAIVPIKRDGAVHTRRSFSLEVRASARCRSACSARCTSTA